MAALEVRDDDLVVTLSGVERLVAMKREVRVPLACIRRVCTDAEPWCALRGMRVQGTGIPGVVAYGVRRLTGARPDFAAIHGRGPAVRVELAPDSRYRRLLVTVADPEATVAALRAEVGSVSADH